MGMFSNPYRAPTRSESPSLRINLKWSMAESLPWKRCTSSSWFSTTYSLGRTFSCHIWAASQQHFASTIRLIMTKWNPLRDLLLLVVVCFLRFPGNSPAAVLFLLGVLSIVLRSIFGFCASRRRGSVEWNSSSATLLSQRVVELMELDWG